MLYDLIITSREAIIPVDAAAVHPTGVYAYCTAKRWILERRNVFFKGHVPQPSAKDGCKAHSG